MLGTGLDEIELLEQLGDSGGTRILAEVPRHLNPLGGLICEIGRGRELLEDDYPELDFFWLDTAESEGEVFWLTADKFKR